MHVEHSRADRLHITKFVQYLDVIFHILHILDRRSIVYDLQSGKDWDRIK